MVVALQTHGILSPARRHERHKRDDAVCSANARATLPPKQNASMLMRASLLQMPRAVL